MWRNEAAANHLVMGCFAIGLLLFCSLLGLADQHCKIVSIGMAGSDRTLGVHVVKSIPLLMVIRRSTASVSPLLLLVTVRWLQTLPPPKKIARSEYELGNPICAVKRPALRIFTGWLHCIISLIS